MNTLKIPTIKFITNILIKSENELISILAYFENAMNNNKFEHPISGVIYFIK